MTQLTVNGRLVELDAPPDTPLLWGLRDYLGLTGTKFGCGAAQCGACTVHVNGAPTRSCVTPLSAVAGKTVVTIEGLSAQGDHPLQKAWIAEQVPQCGYCQSGMLVAAAGLLKEKPKPNESDINSFMTNICACGTYPRVRKAIKRAAGV